jgi:hypothetical protein
MMLALALLLLTQQKNEGLGETPPGNPPKQSQKQTAEQAKFHPGMAPPTSGDMKTSDEQKCQIECSRKMQECMAPAAPKNPDDNSEEKRHDFMMSMQACMKKSQPCIQACSKKGKKEKKESADKDSAGADKAGTP